MVPQRYHLDVRIAANKFGVEMTRREEQVLHYVLNGAANKDIARDLSVSERTAKFHVSNLLRKFGFEKRDELILLFRLR